LEECLPPHDYAGFGRLRAALKTTRIATGEHAAFGNCSNTARPPSGSLTSTGAAA